MSKLIDETEILNIGKKSFDVSNVSVKRKQISRRAYRDLAKQMGENPEQDIIELDDLVVTYGLYMVRQNISVLLKRMPLFKALKSYIRRYILSIRYINNLNEDEYNVFYEWAYFQITGLKKKDLEETDQIQTLLKIANKEIRKVAETPEQQRILLQTLVQDSAGLTSK